MLDQERTYGTHIHEDQEDISGLVVHDMSAMSHGPFVPTFVVFDAYSNSTSFQPPCCPLLHGLTWAAPQIAYSTIPRNGNPANGNHLAKLDATVPQKNGRGLRLRTVEVGRVNSVPAGFT